MNIVTWNINGLRSGLSKEAFQQLSPYDVDILCLQETKVDAKTFENLQMPLQMTGITSAAQKPGYSGVATFTKGIAPKVFTRSYSTEYSEHTEGRILVTEHKVGDVIFYLHNIYFPSGTTGDVRQNFKYSFLDEVHNYFAKLPPDVLQNSVVCGDFNICHQELDIHHPKEATKKQLSGFLPDERSWFTEFCDLGFVDIFRQVNPLEKQYSWWTFRAGARSKNLGWRIDYFLVAAGLRDKVDKVEYLTDIVGSDHAPVLLSLKNSN